MAHEGNAKSGSIYLDALSLYGDYEKDGAWRKVTVEFFTTEADLKAILRLVAHLLLEEAQKTTGSLATKEYPLPSTVVGKEEA